MVPEKRKNKQNTEHRGLSNRNLIGRRRRQPLHVSLSIEKRRRRQFRNIENQINTKISESCDVDALEGHATRGAVAAGSVAVAGDGKLNALAVEGGKTTSYGGSRVLEGIVG